MFPSPAWRGGGKWISAASAPAIAPWTTRRPPSMMETSKLIVIVISSMEGGKNALSEYGSAQGTLLLAAQVLSPLRPHLGRLLQRLQAGGEGASQG